MLMMPSSTPSFSSDPGHAVLVLSQCLTAVGDIDTSETVETESIQDTDDGSGKTAWLGEDQNTYY